jgi:hypothetical protein
MKLKYEKLLGNIQEGGTAIYSSQAPLATLAVHTNVYITYTLQWIHSGIDIKLYLST